MPEIGASAAQAEGTRRRLGRRRGARSERAEKSGVWYPRWYWPSFVAPGSIWLAILFVLPFYVVFAVAFGSVDFSNFGQPVPYYAPWWWSFDTFNQTLSQFYEGTAIYRPALLRTFVYVAAATSICLVVGYTVAYYAARATTRYKGLVLLLLVSPLWISYLMRIYAWQGVLEKDGPINFLLSPLGFGDTNFLGGMHVTVIFGLVYGYIPFMILPIYASLDRIQESLLEAGRDLGGERAPDVLARDASAVTPGDPRRHGDRHAADVRRLLHERPAEQQSADHDVRQPDRRPSVSRRVGRPAWHRSC